VAEGNQMKAARQHIVRAGVCNCGCHGKYHPTSCHRTVLDIVEREQRDAYPGLAHDPEGGRYITDAVGFVRYAADRRKVVRIRYLFGDGRFGEPFWALT
jgi:hypothetical protein